MPPNIRSTNSKGLLILLLSRRLAKDKTHTDAYPADMA